MDIALTHWINSFSGQYATLDWFVIAITKTGPLLLVGLIALRWFARRMRNEQRHIAIQCGLANVIGLLLNQIILLIVQRMRPYEMGFTDLLIEKSQDPSFPSDHATVGFAIAALLIARRDRWALPVILFAIMIGVSRVFVGTHFVGDVLGGAVTGFFGAAIVAHFYHRFNPITDKLVRLL